jgi:hypothetical protein
MYKLCYVFKLTMSVVLLRFVYQLLHDIGFSETITFYYDLSSWERGVDSFVYTDRLKLFCFLSWKQGLVVLFSRVSDTSLVCVLYYEDK